MLSSDTLRKIQQLKIVTRTLMSGPLVGDDAAARIGYGVEFDQIREYHPGDDVRFIDWKSSSRLNKLLVKECLEERNRQIVLAIDVSGTSFYGSCVERFKLMQEVATILAFAAQCAKDSVGLIFFADDIEYVYEPKNTHAYIQKLVQKVYSYQPSSNKRTCVSRVLNYISQHYYKDAVVFVISDLIDDGFDCALRSAAARVDMIMVRCFDEVERALPDAGYLMVEDVELGTTAMIDTRSCAMNQQLLHERIRIQNTLCAQVGVDVLHLSHDHDVCTSLVTFFKRRMLYTRVHAGR
jgi:uncharacterized protein (DUF58 family)